MESSATRVACKAVGGPAHSLVPSACLLPADKAGTGACDQQAAGGEPMACVGDGGVWKLLLARLVTRHVSHLLPGRPVEVAAS